jgi:hypothetical protein
MKNKGDKSHYTADGKKKKWNDSMII